MDTEFHPLEEIRQAATKFAANNTVQLGQNSTIEAGHLDPRLRLRKCISPLSTEPLGRAGNGANMTVIVKCNGEKPWTVYVPVKVKSYLNVAVAVRPLARGLPISKSDITYEQREISRLTSGYYEDMEALIGRTPSRSLPAGGVISPRDMAIEAVISKGSRVSIMAETGGITVRMPGKALEDAGTGDQIQVENLSSKRTVIGTVLGPGIVKVAM